MKKALCSAALGTAFIVAPFSSAHAGMPVFDVLNFASNLTQNFQLKAIKHQLSVGDKGTVVYNTQNIDNSTTNIEKTMTWNYDIDANFTWIIKNPGGEIIPIPRGLEAKISAMRGGTVGEYTANFKDAASYSKAGEEGSLEGLFKGSRSRKAANDMLVEAVELERESIVGEATDLSRISDDMAKAKGHGHQLQVANALAASQIHQLMKLRAAMLISAAQHSAESQVAADKDARALATGVKMRRGLAQAISASPGLTVAR